MDGQWKCGVYTTDYFLFHREEECNAVVCYEKAETGSGGGQEHYIKWNKPDTEIQISRFFLRCVS